MFYVFEFKWMKKMALALHIPIPLNILQHVTTPEDIIILNVQWINTTAVKISHDESRGSASAHVILVD